MSCTHMYSKSDQRRRRFIDRLFRALDHQLRAMEDAHRAARPRRRRPQVKSGKG